VNGGPIRRQEGFSQMRFTRRFALVAAAAALAMPGAALARGERVLVFSKTTGYRHASIEAGFAALKAMGARRGMTVTASEDAGVFDGDGLKNVDVLVLLSNTTNPKDPASEWWTGARGEALQAFVHRGGGVIGIHGATDSHYHWPWYGKLMGGRFARHPKGTPTGDVTVFDRRHPAARGLAPTARRADEWYYFDDYDPTQQLIATLDPQSIGEADVNPNPAAWAHEFEGGRVFYTAMGHTAESFSEPWFLRHLEGGLDWVLTKRR
jgi:uncharacterized protein